MSAAALETLGRVLEEGGEPDDVLRSAVSVLADEPGIAWAGVAFHEDGALVLGPEAGEADETMRMCVPVLFQGAEVGQLWVDGDAGRPFLDQVAALIAAHVLIGWDTGGERWEP